MVDKRNVELTVHKYVNGDGAFLALSPFTIYSFLFNGKFVTNEVLSENKFIKVLNEKEI
ncbi:YoaP domain-containing protein [Clostridium sp. ZS2]|uniref:YoaP domain-containing protein n=1 Tax=Clostridium sp. ZS2 TaxID=2949988 RepID=UPI0013F72114|nr:YoaP domain-containing protein [Clostridium sp. ZS2]MBN1068205.1 hypothetical protein [Clostridium botulinum]NFR88055.1 hypothetical protein [Clostridium botulinum]NFR91150.1 hypothetical protein [Clostridium botulinum]NFU00530.1 hypothetical protein [Clostridium botulinum]